MNEYLFGVPMVVMDLAYLGAARRASNPAKL